MHDGEIKLNLGGGKFWRMDGWENLDIELGYDLDKMGLKTYAAGSVSKIYASHSLEHMRPEAMYRLLLDTRRVLKPGGVFRIIIPDVELHIKQMQTAEFFSGPNPLFFSSPTDQIIHMGGNPQGLQYPSRIGHYFFYDKYTLSWLLIMAGFTKMVYAEHGVSSDKEFEIIADRTSSIWTGFDYPDLELFHAMSKLLVENTSGRRVKGLYGKII